MNFVEVYEKMKTTETKKKRCRSPSETNLTNNTNALMEMKFFGEFWEYSVGITDQNAIEALVKHGNFGKGILSRSAPKFFQRGNEEFLPIESKPNTEKRIAHRKRPKLALLASNSAEHEEYDDATMKFPSSSETIEPLQLSLVEAFYLSNVLKCLLIRYQNDTISVNEQWTLFQKFQPNFVVQYIVYGHYRKRGWIPKSGLKFGVDFVLYKSDPDHCHAEYDFLEDEDRVTKKKNDWKHETNILSSTVSQLLFILLGLNSTYSLLKMSIVIGIG
jgi:tRNA-splicing endonuclease subunit Sen2